MQAMVSLTMTGSGVALKPNETPEHIIADHRGKKNSVKVKPFISYGPEDDSNHLKYCPRQLPLDGASSATCLVMFRDIRDEEEVGQITVFLQNNSVTARVVNLR